MYVPERKVILLAELFEPVVCSIVVHGVSVSRCEQPVALEPRAAELSSLRVLCRLMLAENILHEIGKFQRTPRLLGFGRIGVNARLYGIIRRSADTDDVVLPVNILPLYTARVKNVRYFRGAPI